MCLIDAVCTQMAERWLPRPEEGLWPVEEDRLEDSLEDLGAAGGSLLGWAGVGAQHPLPASLPPPGLLCLSTDDFLEPEEYAEPQEAKPGEAADLGRSESELLARGGGGGPGDSGGGEGCGPWPQKLIAAPFPEAEAVPASLSYEELVRRNVVGPSQSRWGRWVRGSCTEGGSSWSRPRSSSSPHLRSSCRRRS